MQLSSVDVGEVRKDGECIVNTESFTVSLMGIVVVVFKIVQRNIFYITCRHHSIFSA